MAEESLPRRRGPPTLHRPEYDEQAYKLCLLGATLDELADFFGVCAKTVDNWVVKHPEFADAVRRGRMQADANVAERLYERARGYSHEAVKIFMPPGGGDPVYAPYIEHYPPDTAAASLWLRNRQPQRWRDKQEIDHTGGVTIEHLIIEAATRKPAGDLVLEALPQLSGPDGEGR